jgi:hypothetical protein
MPKRVEDRLKIKDVPRYIKQTTGVDKGVWVIYHWIRKGRRTYSNRLLKLKTERVCGQIFTRQSWVNDFLRELEL